MDYSELLSEGAGMLEPLEYADPGFEAKELLGTVVGHDPRSAGFRMLLDEPVSEEHRTRFLDLVRRRLEGEPLQYLLGEWDFFGFTFTVGRGVLIPRPDTELIVELALKLYKNRDSIKVLDLCAGSGCIGLSIELKKKKISLTLIEKSPQAFEYLSENMVRFRSRGRAVQGDVLDESLAAQFKDFDLIVCNPPYLTPCDMEDLQKEVRAEPPEALFGGEDGLDFYRTVTRLWKSALAPGGGLIYETGWLQAEEVAGIMIQHGFKDVRIRRDIEGRQRAVTGFLRHGNQFLQK